MDDHGYFAWMIVIALITGALFVLMELEDIFGEILSTVLLGLVGLVGLVWLGWLGFQVVAWLFKKRWTALGVWIGVVLLILFVNVIIYVVTGTIDWFGWLLGRG